MRRWPRRVLGVSAPLLNRAHIQAPVYAKARTTMQTQNWERSYRMACDERDPDQCRVLIQDTEQLIFFRISELRAGARSSPAQTEELKRLTAALTELQQLKVDRLGWAGLNP